MQYPTLRRTIDLPKPVFRRILGLAFLLPLFVACSSSDDDDDPVTSPDESTALINMPVQAGVGGTFTSSDGRITVLIPADAITEDSTLVVTEVDGLTHATVNQSPAGDAFAIEFGTTLV